jgi:Protein of unknown function (DUF4232)
VTLAPPRPPSSEELEALIRQARARQRRRRLAIVALFTAAAAAAVGTYAIVAGALSTATANHGSQPARFAPGDRCQSEQLRLVGGDGGVAAGTYSRAFSLVNDSNRSCTLRGWPTFRLVMRDGRRIIPRVRRLHYFSTGIPNRGLPPKTIALRPGHAGSFILLDQDFNSKTGRTCARVRTMFVIPPGDEGSLPIPAGIGSYCAPLIVPPLVAGRNPRHP